MIRIIVCIAFLSVPVALMSGEPELYRLGPKVAPRVEPPKHQESEKKHQQPTPKVAPKPSNPTGLNHSVDGNKMVQKRTVVHFHHCLKGCKPCPAAYSWAFHNAPHLAGDVVFHEYADLDAAGAAGIPFVPSFEIDGNFVGIDLDRKNRRKHRAGMVCPDCINQWIRTGGKWPPGNVQFDKPADVRVAAKAASLNLKPQVASAFDAWDKWVGDAVVSVEWQRPLAEREFSLWRGEQTDYSPASIFGSDQGRVSFNAPGSKLPIQQYSIECKGDANAVYLRGDWIRIGMDGKPMAAAQPVGIEPASILTILSAAVSLLRIHADLILPKNVIFAIEKQGDTFTIGFVQGKEPSVRVSHLWRSYLTLPTVTVTREAATLNLKGSWFLPKRKVIKF